MEEQSAQARSSWEASPLLWVEVTRGSFPSCLIWRLIGEALVIFDIKWNPMEERIVITGYRTTEYGTREATRLAVESTWSIAVILPSSNHLRDPQNPPLLSPRQSAINRLYLLGHSIDREILSLFAKKIDAER